MSRTEVSGRIPNTHQPRTSHTETRAGPDIQELTIEGGLPAGEYSFRCDVHPAIMTGTLIVE